MYETAVSSVKRKERRINFEFKEKKINSKTGRNLVCMSAVSVCASCRVCMRAVGRCVVLRCVLQSVYFVSKEENMKNA